MLQGRKRILLGDETLDCDPGRCLITSLDLPVQSAVTEASPERPLLGVGLPATGAYATSGQLRHEAVAHRPPREGRRGQQGAGEENNESGGKKKGTDHAGTLTDTGRPHCALRALCVAQNFTT